MMNPTLKTIIKVASEVLEVPEEELRGPRRTASVSWARRITIAAAVHIGHSKISVARALDKDHTSITYALSKIYEAGDEEYRQNKQAIDKVIKAATEPQSP